MSHAIRSHLNCITNNLAWIRDSSQESYLRADGCPGREFILKNGTHADPELESMLCDCERACVELRDAFNRRDLGGLTRAAQERTVCLKKLSSALKKHGHSAPLWQAQAA